MNIRQEFRDFLNEAKVSVVTLKVMVQKNMLV